MRRFIIIFAALLAVAAIAGMTACGSAKNNNPDTLSSSDGYTVSANQLVVQFEVTCNQDGQNAVLKEYGMKSLYHDEFSTTLYKVQLDHNHTAQELMDLMSQLKSDSRVDKVAYVYIGKAPGVYW